MKILSLSIYFFGVGTYSFFISRFVFIVHNIEHMVGTLSIKDAYNAMRIFDNYKTLHLQEIIVFLRHVCEMILK